jgi:hypothetical protein
MPIECFSGLVVAILEGKKNEEEVFIVVAV